MRKQKTSVLEKRFESGKKGFSKRVDTLFFLLVFIGTAIFVLGLTTLFSTTSAEAFEHGFAKGVTQALLRQTVYMAFGMGLGIAVWLMGFTNLYRHSTLLFFLGIFLLILTLIPGIGKEVNGSRRWLVIAGMSLQPSEFVKGLLPLFFISRALPLRQEGYPFLPTMKLALQCIFPLVLIILEPNNGTAAVMGATLLVLCWLLRIPARYWALPVMIFSCAAVVCAIQLPYVAGRLSVYWNPERDLLGKGHQPYQAKIAAGSGMLWGKGPGNSWQKLSFLPEAQNDYIAAIYAEEYGFAGILVLIFLYSSALIVAMTLLFAVQERAAFAFCATFLFLFFFQVFLNLGVVCGLLPSTGLNLPLFSQGGSSLMANLVGWSLFLRICHDARYTSFSKGGIQRSHVYF